METQWYFTTILHVKEIGDTAVQIKKLYNNHVRMIVLAPYYDYTDGYETNLSRLQYCEQLVKESRKKYNSLSIVLGSSVKYVEQLSDLLKKRMVKTVSNGKNLLVRFEDNCDYSFMKNAVKHCYDMGIRPVIEDFFNKEALKNFDHAQDIIEQGAYLCSHIDNVYNQKRASKKKIASYVEKWMIHLIYDDFTTHTVDTYRKIVDEFTEKFGKHRAEDIFSKNFKKLYDDQIIE